jgi:hypothetical protein
VSACNILYKLQTTAHESECLLAVEGVSFEGAGRDLFVACAASFAFSVRIRFRGPLTGSIGVRTSRGMAAMALDGM